MYDEEQKVRELAYDLWDQAGRPDGSAEEFWFAAKQQLAGPNGQPEFANAPKAAARGPQIAAEAPQISAAPQAKSARAPEAQLSEPGKTRQAARKSR